MPTASIGRVTSEVGNACAEWYAGTKPFWLQSLRIVNATTTASIYSLRRPGAIGITPTALVPPIYQGPGTITTRMAVAWGTKPTSGADELFFHAILTGAVGYAIDFDFTNNGRIPGIYVPAAAGGVISSLVLWGHSTVAAVYANAKILE